MSLTILVPLILALCVGAGWLFRRMDTAPYPYALHWILNIPLPGLTNRQLLRLLQPLSGERFLEIGPGTGLQATAVAPLLGKYGRLDIVDIQADMLAVATKNIHKVDLDHVVATQADACNLPFPDNSFDGAYLVTTLGEITEPLAALHELHRVVKPNGRIVIGEWVIFERHGIHLAQLEQWATAGGFKTETTKNSRFAYFAYLKPR